MIEENRIIAINLQALMNKYGKTAKEIAAAIGVSGATMSWWINGKAYPRAKYLTALADYFGVSIADLTDEAPIKPPARKQTSRRIPVIGRIQADASFETILKHHVDTWEDITVDAGEYFGLRVTGDSMSDSGIFDGDIAIIKRQPDALSGQLVCAIVSQQDATIRQIIKYPNGNIELRPASRHYEPIIFKREELYDGEVRLLGVVVELRRKL